MKIFLSPQYIKSFKRLKKKNPQIISIVKEKITLFKINPNHSSLKLHKLQGKKLSLWSFWIKRDLRLTFTYVREGILFINIGTHQEVY